MERQFFTIDLELIRKILIGFIAVNNLLKELRNVICQAAVQPGARLFCLMLILPFLNKKSLVGSFCFASDLKVKRKNVQSKGF